MLRWALHRISLDHIMCGSVVVACGGVVYQAHAEGTIPLTQHTVADQDARCPRLHLTSSQCRTLETAGYLVVDDFLTADEVSNAAEAAREIQRYNNALTRSHRNSTNKEQGDPPSVVFTGIRESSLAEFDASYVGGTEGVPDARPYDDDALLHVRTLMRGLAHSVRTSAFAGFRCNPPAGRLGVPDTLQLSLYRAHHVVANYNAAHRDGMKDMIWQTGILGHLRSKYLRRRYLTCILYLNDRHDWDGTSDGGQLRIYEEDVSSSFADIEPRGGRLVLLDSESTLHAVLPSRRDRIACSIWFTRH